MAGAEEAITTKEEEPIITHHPMSDTSFVVRKLSVKFLVRSLAINSRCKQSLFNTQAEMAMVLARVKAIVLLK